MFGEGNILSTQVRREFRRLGTDDSGASAAEYALLLAIIGGSLALATVSLGHSVGCSIDSSASIIEGDPVTGHNYGNSDPNGLAKGHRPNC